MLNAARDGDAAAVTAWCAAHPGMVDGPPGWAGSTALAHAASGGSRATVEVLLAAGADQNHRTGTFGATALHYATFKARDRMWCFRCARACAGCHLRISRVARWTSRR